MSVFARVEKNLVRVQALKVVLYDKILIEGLDPDHRPAAEAWSTHAEAWASAILERDLFYLERALWEDVESARETLRWLLERPSAGCTDFLEKLYERYTAEAVCARMATAACKG